ncbi:unnamed protein product [Mytilus coruscus]|uniref:Uncharacterized protein n=1 Tax=Mytilus coruscus TaxID=42192 RepID=A0A6J8ETC0_MYTCO|nr:unnamed protein product [Mytilus coruscus]
METGEYGQAGQRVVLVCDSGYETRNRLCNHLVPSSRSSYCNGKSFEVLNCSIARCRVPLVVLEQEDVMIPYQCLVDHRVMEGQENNVHVLAVAVQLMDIGDIGRNGNLVIKRGEMVSNNDPEHVSLFPMFGGSECIGVGFNIQNCSKNICLGAKHEQQHDKISQTFSIEVLGGVATGCIAVPVVVIAIALFVFRRFRCDQTGKNNDCDGELRDTSLPSNYEFIGPSNGVQNGVYDTYNITCSSHDNTQFNGGNEALYENMKI